MRLQSLFTWSVAGPAIDKLPDRSTCGGRSAALKPVQTTLEDGKILHENERNIESSGDFLKA